MSFSGGNELGLQFPELDTLTLSKYSNTADDAVVVDDVKLLNVTDGLEVTAGLIMPSGW